MTAAASLPPRRRTAAVVVIACVMVLELLDMTILNVAIPTLKAEFDASPAQVQWMVAGYTTVFALLLVTGGRLGDIYGYRRMLLIGMTVFTLASLLCGLAPGPDALVGARLLQGFGGALMVPQGTSLIQLMFAPHERMKPLALYGLLGGLATMAGPIVGGAIIGANWFGLSWRPGFLVNLPVGIVTLIVAARALPGDRSAHAPTLDRQGMVLSMAALLALLLPLIQGAHSGWPWWSWAMLGASLPLGVALWRHSRAREAAGGSPLIVPSLFGIAGLRVGLSVTVVFQLASTGFLFVLPIALQSGLGMSATDSGLVHMPLALTVALGIGLLSRRLLPRLGTRMIALGCVAMALGIGWVALTVATVLPSVPGPLFAPMALAGFGMGLVVGPLPPCTLSDVDVAHAGAGSGMLKTTQQLGSALGVALIGNLFFALGGAEGGAAILPAWLQTLAAIGALLLGAGAMALRFPRDLRLFAPQAVSTAAP